MDFILFLLKAMAIAFIAILAVLFVVGIFSGKKEEEIKGRRDKALSRLKKFKPTHFHENLAFDKENGALAIIDDSPSEVRILMIDPKSIIESECLIDGKSVSVTKNKGSTILRAAVGGVLLGPVGAVVGAVSAGGTKTTTVTETKEYRLKITFNRPDFQIKIAKFKTENSMMLWDSFLKISMRQTEMLEPSPEPYISSQFESEEAVPLISGMAAQKRVEDLNILKENGFISEEEYVKEMSKLDLAV